MNYLSSKEIASLWNISSRRVVILASEGRIPGAKLVGKTWLIPNDAAKPADARYKETNENTEVSFFPLLVFYYDSYETAEKNLTKTQLELYKAQKECISGNFKEADVLLSQILNTTDNICITFGALYFKIYTDIFLYNQESLLRTYSLIQQIDISKSKNKEELYLVLVDMKGILTGNKEYIENFSINRNYNYSSEVLPYLILLETYTSLVKSYISKEKSEIFFPESAVIYMKQGNFIYSEISLHIYIALIYMTSGNIKDYDFHIQQALQLAEKYEIFLPLILSYKTIQLQVSKYLSEYPSSVIKNLPSLSITFHENTDRFLKKINISKVYFSLNPEEIFLIEATRQGLTNKEIARIKNISESYVSKKYFILCKKLEVSSKKELVNIFIENMKL